MFYIEFFDKEFCSPAFRSKAFNTELEALHWASQIEGACTAFDLRLKKGSEVLMSLNTDKEWASAWNGVTR